MDGTNREIIHKTELGFPNCLAIDYHQNKLYWSDTFNGKIEVSELNGKNRMLLIPQTTTPTGLTLVSTYLSIPTEFKL